MPEPLTQRNPWLILNGELAHLSPACFSYPRSPIPGRSSQPSSLCQAYLTYTTSVALGAQSGIEECKFQFAWERWNCPENALQLSTHNRLRSGKFVWNSPVQGVYMGMEGRLQYVFMCDMYCTVK